jgi:hypothetical protein
VIAVTELVNPLAMIKLLDAAIGSARSVGIAAAQSAG